MIYFLSFLSFCVGWWCSSQVFTMVLDFLEVDNEEFAAARIRFLEAVNKAFDKTRKRLGITSW